MQVNLSWNAVTGALYYKIYRGLVTGGPYQLIGQSNPNPGQNPGSGTVTTTYQDGPGNIGNAQDYFYVVTTVGNDGESAYSSEYHAVAPSAPAAPGGLTAVVT